MYQFLQSQAMTFKSQEVGPTGPTGPSARSSVDQDQSCECALASEEVALAIGRRCNPVGQLIAKVNDVQSIRVASSQFSC